MRFLSGTMVQAACLAATVAMRGQDTGAAAGGASTSNQTPPNKTVRIAGGVIAGHIQTLIPPAYPPEAKAAGVGGTVILHAVIGQDGKIQLLKVVSGPDLLQQAALDAVRQWTYKPYLLNGQPISVDTTIMVNFNLNKPKPVSPSEMNP
ncbi:TonB family protein [Granulicella mallensis MP5ACTX8]|uniref:TonB family protein n=2 Tax=Granulicella mallensis TaxID=940614 RepID=G8NVT9_GRAMM|nr:TonB family protein [Granulicella mallensis MP5ACTX8]